MTERGSHRRDRRSFLRTLLAAGGAGALAAALPKVSAAETSTGPLIRVDAERDIFANGRRLHTAWNDLVASGGGTLVLGPGEYRIPAPLVCRDHRDGTPAEPIAVVGEGSPLRGVLVKAGWRELHEAMVDLSGSSHFSFRNVFFDGAYAGAPRARYGLVLRRTDGSSAGRHVLEHTTFTNFTRTAMLSHASEMLTAVGCNFQRAPIGAVITAYPIKSIATDEDFATPGKDIIRWKGTPESNGGGVFINTTFGDALVTSRASLLMAQQSPSRHVGCVYQTRPGAEAKVIMDECWGGHFSSPWSDQGGAPTVFKVGKYSPNYGPNRDKYQNRFDLFDAKVDAEPGALILDGSNMKGCSLRNVWANREDVAIRLDPSCTWTVVENATCGIAFTAKMPIEDQGVGSLCRWGTTAVGHGRGRGPPTTDDFALGEHGLYQEDDSGKVYYVMNQGGALKKVELN